MSLLDLQTRWQAGLTDPDATTPCDIAGAEAPRRFAIYRNAYRGRLVEALGEAFDKAWAYLGDADFHATASAYVQAYPPVSRSLNDYGQGFPVHLAAAWPADPEVAELAWLDWSLRRGFDGPDAVPLTAEALRDLSAEDWDVVGFTLVPTLSLRLLTTNAPALWTAIAAGEPPPPARVAEPDSWLRVWRKGYQPHFATITAREARALGFLADGGGFAALCETLADEGDPDEAITLSGAWLATWLSEGLIGGLRW